MAKREDLFYTKDETITVDVGGDFVIEFTHLTVAERIKLAQAIQNNVEDPTGTADIMSGKLLKINGIEGPFSSEELLNLKGSKALSTFSNFARTMLANAEVDKVEEKKSD